MLSIPLSSDAFHTLPPYALKAEMSLRRRYRHCHGHHWLLAPHPCIVPRYTWHWSFHLWPVRVRSDLEYKEGMKSAGSDQSVNQKLRYPKPRRAPCADTPSARQRDADPPIDVSLIKESSFSRTVTSSFILDEPVLKPLQHLHCCDFSRGFSLVLSILFAFFSWFYFILYFPCEVKEPPCNFYLTFHSKI